MARMVSMVEAPEDWMAQWQPMVQAIGTDFEADAPLVWGERIDAAMVARYLEPLEFDCALHADAAVARALGHADVVVPDTALVSMSLPLMWRPGDRALFTTDGRNDLPDRASLAGRRCGLEPPTAHTFAVQWDMDFLQPAVVGDRLCRRGLLLVSCTPKQTRMGRGAFITCQSEIINERHEVLARIRSTLYRFDSHPGEPKRASHP